MLIVKSTGLNIPDNITHIHVYKVYTKVLSRVVTYMYIQLQREGEELGGGGGRILVYACMLSVQFSIIGGTA